MTANPFAIQKQETATTLVESERAVQETQAAMVIAKRFPRDQAAAMDRIIQACTRPTLAQQGLYAYPRGGQMITGPSIRLAEAIAQCWGNMQFGIRELEQRNGVSTIQAFAWDIESNTRQVKEFQVKHERKARGGITSLDDPRDIYELVANQGARRMRACILSVIPGDVQDAAQRQCELTMQNLDGAPEDQIKALAQAFQEIGVSQKQIETRLGHRIGSTISAEIISLRKIYRSIKDGMSDPADWFDGDKAATSDVASKIAEKAKEPKPKWPQEQNGVFYDSRGVPWMEEGHSATKAVTQDGHWRRRRGIDPSQLHELEKPYLEPNKEKNITPAQLDELDPTQLNKIVSSPEDEGSEPEQKITIVSQGKTVVSSLSFDEKGMTLTDKETMFDEAWFNKGISGARNDEEVTEFEDVLKDTDLHPEVRAGIEHKIAARRAELNAANE